MKANCQELFCCWTKECQNCHPDLWILNVQYGRVLAQNIHVLKLSTDCEYIMIFDIMTYMYGVAEKSTDAC